MSKSDELVNFLSKLLEKGILNGQDVKKEIITKSKIKPKISTCVPAF